MPKAPPPIRIGLDLGDGSLRALLLRPDGQLRTAEVSSAVGPLGSQLAAALGELLPQTPRSSSAASGPTRVAPIELVLSSRRPWQRLQAGCRVALLITDGFTDLPRLLDRRLDDGEPEPSGLLGRRLGELVPPECCLAVRERLGADGSVVVPLSAAALTSLVAEVAALDVQAVAVVLLHSYQNDAHERTVAAALAPLGLPISLSSGVARYPDERLRATATLLDAAFAATVAEEAAAAATIPGSRLLRIESTAQAVPGAAALPLRCGLSSVTAGLLGAQRLLAASGVARFVAVVVEPELVSVALYDPLLAAVASPRRSALGEPAMELALLATAQAAPTLEAIAAAVETVTVDAGHDPADYPLYCFGSGGEALAPRLAGALGLQGSAVSVLPAPAWVAAYGALCAPLVCGRGELMLVEASIAQQTGQVAATLHSLGGRLRSELRRDGLVASDFLPGQEWLAELRYQGQRQCLTLTGQGDGGPAASGATDLVVRFCAEHQRRYGFTLAECPVELMSLQSRVTIPVAMPQAAALAAIG